MKYSHTPGHIHYASASSYRVTKHEEGFWLLDSDCNIIATYHNLPNAEADVKLACAAPDFILQRDELREALKGVLEHYAPQSLQADDWVFSGNSQTDAVIRQARSALTNATQAASGVDRE